MSGRGGEVGKEKKKKEDGKRSLTSRRTRDQKLQARGERGLVGTFVQTNGKPAAYIGRKRYTALKREAYRSTKEEDVTEPSTTPPTKSPLRGKKKKHRDIRLNRPQEGIFVPLPSSGFESWVTTQTSSST